MSNKEIITKVFNEEFNSEKIKKQILLNYAKKEKNKISLTLKFALPICIIAIICGIMLSHNLFNQKSNIFTYNNNIIINKINNLGALKFDADIKPISNNGLNIPLPNFLIELAIPSDLNKFDGYSIYTRKDKTSAYDILNCYVYNYYESSFSRNIRLAFSNQNKPLRDYHFSEKEAKESTINNKELTIYQYKEIYFAEFEYKGYNFDIETNNITIEELTLFLTSIIK